MNRVNPFALLASNSSESESCTESEEEQKGTKAPNKAQPNKGQTNKGQPSRGNNSNNDGNNNKSQSLTDANSINNANTRKKATKGSTKDTAETPTFDEFNVWNALKIALGPDNVVNIDCIYLYGSRLWGINTSQSDYDFVVLFSRAIGPLDGWTEDINGEPVVINCILPGRGKIDFSLYTWDYIHRKAKENAPFALVLLQIPPQMIYLERKKINVLEVIKDEKLAQRNYERQPILIWIRVQADVVQTLCRPKEIMESRKHSLLQELFALLHLLFSHQMLKTGGRIVDWSCIVPIYVTLFPERCGNHKTIPEENLEFFNSDVGLSNVENLSKWYDEKADKLYQNIAACVKPKPAESMNDGFSPKKRGATAKAKVGSYTPRDLCRAVRAGCLEMVEAILKERVGPDNAGFEHVYHRPLPMALYYYIDAPTRFLPIISLLLSAGARMDGPVKPYRIALCNPRDPQCGTERETTDQEWKYIDHIFCGGVCLAIAIGDDDLFYLLVRHLQARAKTDADYSSFLQYSFWTERQQQVSIWSFLKTQPETVQRKYTNALNLSSRFIDERQENSTIFYAPDQLKYLHRDTKRELRTFLLCCEKYPIQLPQELKYKIIELVVMAPKPRGKSLVVFTSNPWKVPYESRSNV